MKRLFFTSVAICLMVFSVSPGFAEEKYRMKNYAPAGSGGRVQHVTGSFVRDTALDTNLAPLVFIDELEQSCVVNNATVTITGDIVGANPILSDVFCFSSLIGRDEAAGWIHGILDGKPIYMLGRMTVTIDFTNGKLDGYWVFTEGVGTHYGVLILEGQIDFSLDYPVSTGTYKGWVRKNKCRFRQSSG